MVKNLFFSILLILSFILVLLFSNNGIASENKILTISWEDWEPFSYLDENGNLTGIDVELVLECSKRAGYELKFMEMPWARSIHELEFGTLDIVFEAFKTKERQQFAFFSMPFRSESYILWIRKEDASRYSFISFDDLIQDTTFRLGLIRGYKYSEEINAKLERDILKNRFEYVTRKEQNYQKLLTLRINGFIDEVFLTHYNLHKNDLLNQIEPHQMKFYSADTFIMFSKKSVPIEVVDAFNCGLQTMRNDGTYLQLIDKYIK